MPIALFVALAGSLLFHGLALVGTEIELFAGGEEPVRIQAELLPPPAPPPPAAANKPVKKPVKRPAVKPVAASASVVVPDAAPDVVEPDTAFVENGPNFESTAARSPSPPATPVLAGSGLIRYVISKVSLNMEIGRVEQHWEFNADGTYRLSSVNETTGLAAVFKPVRVDMESRGRMVSGGLQPEQLRTLKNGQDNNENADFDWVAGEVRLSRDGSVRPVAPGSQDILSLNYQLAYLGKVADGVMLGVVTGRKYERHALDSLGEEEIVTPAGTFRTLHLRAMTDKTTEIWIALDHHRLPVKIRFTDKKGESYEQVATEIGMQ